MQAEDFNRVFLGFQRIIKSTRQKNKCLWCTGKMLNQIFMNFKRLLVKWKLREILEQNTIELWIYIITLRFYCRHYITFTFQVGLYILFLFFLEGGGAETHSWIFYCFMTYATRLLNISRLRRFSQSSIRVDHKVWMINCLPITRKNILHKKMTEDGPVIIHTHAYSRQLLILLQVSTDILLQACYSRGMIGRCKKKSEYLQHVASDKNLNVYLGRSTIRKAWHFRIMFTKETSTTKLKSK